MRRNIYHRNSVVDRKAFVHIVVICLAAALTALFFIHRGATLSAALVADVPESFATGQGTGLVLGFDEGANVWFAHAVWAGSPAEQAGIPVGAPVVSIGGIALPVGAIANDPSALTEIESRLGAAASVGNIAVGWVDSGGAPHNDQIRFEPMPDLYLRATVNGGPPPVLCFVCMCGSGPPPPPPTCGPCNLTNGPGYLLCLSRVTGCVHTGPCMPIGPTPTPPPLPRPPPLSGVASRMSHGSAGTFDIDLPQTGTRGVECRSDGSGNYSMVFTFVNTVTSCGVASTTEGTAMVTPGPAANPALNANQCMVSLTGVPNASHVTVTLTDAADSAGNAGNVSATMGVLIGDVNGNGLVNSTDTSKVQAQSGKPVTFSNFRMDVNANGLINSTDTSIVQSKSGTGLPTSP